MLSIFKLKNILSIFILVAALMSIKIFAADLSDIKTITPEQQSMLDIMKKNGVKTDSIYEFYEAGSACYQHTLKKITYFMNGYNVLVFFNDPLGNCILSDVGIANLTPTYHYENHICIITETLYRYLTSPQNESAAKQYAATNNASGDFNRMIGVLDQCAKVINDNELLIFLKSSTQLK